MKLLLTITVIVLVSYFLIGMIMAAIKGNSRKRRAYAIVTLSKLPQGTVAKLKELWKAYQSSDIKETNGIVESIDPNILSDVLDALSVEKRPLDFSSGKMGDNMLYFATFAEMQDKGYSKKASALVASIITHELDRAL